MILIKQNEKSDKLLLEENKNSLLKIAKRELQE